MSSRLPFVAWALGCLLSAASAQAGLIGISYDAVSSHNQVRSVNSSTGATTLLNSFDFSTGTWIAPVIPDADAGVFYAQSGDGFLYTFDGNTGAVLATTALDTVMQAMTVLSAGALVGISYDAVSGHNEVRSVDPSTGATTLLNSFDFSSGLWVPGVIPDVDAGLFYAQSSDGLLYSFDGDTGAILATTPLDTMMQSVAVLSAGTLVGVSYDTVSGHNEVRSVDPSTGATTLLNSFDFSSGFWVSTVIPDVEAGLFYAESSDGLLYTFDGDTGAILATTPLDTMMQSMAVLPAGSIVISECDTGVPNQTLPGGRTMSEALEVCLTLGVPRGLGRRCVNALTHLWIKTGLITRAESEAIRSCLPRVPRRGGVRRPR